MIRDVSTALHAEASQHLVGGVNSPVRAFKSVHGDPIYIKDAKGATITDADGNTLVDFVQSWGPLIHGHAHPNVLKAVTKTMARGTSYGAPHIGEIRLARKVKSIFPMMDLVRFVSSGTEAVMSAIRLARGFTGRDTVLKFEGCYHGHVDALMVNAGSGLATFGIASSPGIPESTVATTVVASLDDEAMVDHIFAEQGDDVAAVVIEPMPANNGLLVQRESFLQHLRDRCDEHGALLIFDEVITGFRFAEGGITGHVGVTPDLVALGKVIGGGLPVGAYGGPEHIMQQLAPLGPVYQAGTLSGNPLAMAAGCATLDLLNDDAHAHLEALGTLLETLVTPVLARHGHPMRLVRQASLFWFSPGPEAPPRRSDLIPNTAGVLYADVHQGLLERGYMLAPSAYEVGFLSTAHEAHHIEGFVAALDEVLTVLEVGQ